MLKIIKKNIKKYEKVYVISDIHGYIDLFDRMLEKLNLTKKDLLIIDGDSCDRGENTFLVYNRIINLKKEGFEIIHIKGNHEKMFYDYINFEENKELWIRNGGDKTLEAYKLQNNEILEKHMNFIDEMPLILIIGEYVIVHAGVNPFKRLKEQNERDLLWIRDEFFGIKSKKIRKTIVFGHTPTKNGKVLFYENNTIGIDCGSYLNNRLGAIELKNKKEYYIGRSE